MIRTYQSWPEEAVDFRCYHPEGRGVFTGLLERVDAPALLREYEALSFTMLEVRSFGAPAAVADASGRRELAGMRLASRVPLAAGTDKVATASSQAFASPPSQVDLPMWEQRAAHLVEICKEVLAARGCN